MRWRAAAEEDGIDFTGTAELFELSFQRFQIIADQVVAACDQGEVAVSAAMGAKRHMDIGGAGFVKVCDLQCAFKAKGEVDRRAYREASLRIDL